MEFNHFDGFCHFQSFNQHLYHHFWPFNQHFNQKSVKFYRKQINLIFLNWKLVNFIQISTSSFNQNPILTSDFKSDRIGATKLLESELKSTTIWFIGPSLDNTNTGLAYKATQFYLFFRKSFNLKFQRRILNSVMFCVSTNQRHIKWRKIIPKLLWMNLPWGLKLRGCFALANFK